MKLLKYVPLLALLACEPPLNKFSDPEMIEIFELKDRRDTDGLIPYLSTHHHGHKYDAILAFATLQDSAALEFLYPGLDDSAEDIRKVTAFAVGQTKSTSSVDLLIEKIGKEQNTRVTYELLIALGRCATPQALNFLINYVPKDSLLSEGRVWGIYRAGLRGVKSEEGTAAVVKVMSDKNSAVRFAASNYLGRIAREELDQFQDQMISLALKESDPLAKMNLVRALGKLSGEEVPETIYSVLSSEQDYRVHVNALRALKSIGEEQLPTVRELLKTGHSQLALPAAQLIARSEFSSELLFEIAKTTEDAVAEGLLFKTALNIASDAQIVDELKGEIAKVAEPYKKGQLIRTMAYGEQELSYLSDLALNGDHSYVQTSAMDAILELLARSDQAEQYASVLRSAIASGDIGLLPLASSALVSDAYGFKSIFEDFSFLYEAKNALELPQDAEALIALQRAIDYFEGGEASVPVENPYNNPINWAHLQNLPKDQKARIETAKGTIDIQFFVEESPGTVDFISRLIEHGFYNGLTFHRVVSNFVAQGGCPRGDGFGGTQESIRSEFGYHSYQTGTLGMASAGKDTESCQFFITHRPTPHLDGAYTVFGKVVAGMDVAEKLTLGDVITSITLLKEEGAQ